MGDRPGVRRRLLLWGATVAVATGLVVPGAVADVTPDPDAPTADCRVEAGRSSREVRCEVSGVAADAQVVLRVRALPQDDTDAWVGGGTVGGEGRGVAAVTVPCTGVEQVRAEVTAPTLDEGRFRHVEDLDVDRPCRAGIGELVWVAAAGALVLVLVGALVWRRRRRRRVTRAGRARPAARRPRGGGRRRSRGRRSRRR